MVTKKYKMTVEVDEDQIVNLNLTKGEYEQQLKSIKETYDKVKDSDFFDVRLFNHEQHDDNAHLTIKKDILKYGYTELTVYAFICDEGYHFTK